MGLAPKAATIRGQKRRRDQSGNSDNDETSAAAAAKAKRIKAKQVSACYFHYAPQSMVLTPFWAAQAKVQRALRELDAERGGSVKIEVNEDSGTITNPIDITWL